MSQEAKPPAVMAAEQWDHPLARRLQDELPQDQIACQQYRGQPFVIVPSEALERVASFLRHHAGYDYIVDLTAVDRPHAVPRFEIVVILYSFADNHRLRIKAPLADGAECPSLTGLYEGARWLEREVFDMFGIRFTGHAGLKRILMPEDWQGFPLRKEKSIVDMDQEWVQKHLGIESGQ